jgi:hypothetical protein
LVDAVQHHGGQRGSLMVTRTPPSRVAVTTPPKARHIDAKISGHHRRPRRYWSYRVGLPKCASLRAQSLGRSVQRDVGFVETSRRYWLEDSRALSST